MSVELESAGLNRFDSVLKIANVTPICSYESDSIRQVAEQIILTKHRRIPIISRKRKLVGIITIMDILDAFLRGLSFDEKISTIMIRDVIYCKVDDKIGFVLQKFKLSRRGGFPIVDDDMNIIGIVSERDFVKHFSDVTFGTKVKEVMTPKPFVLKPEMSIIDSLKSLVNTHYRRLPVVEGKKLVGLIVAVDFLKYIRSKNYELTDLTSPITSILIRDVYTVDKEADVSFAVKIMKKHDIGGILVVDREKILEGIITERDVLRKIM